MAYKALRKYLSKNLQTSVMHSSEPNKLYYCRPFPRFLFQHPAQITNEYGDHSITL